MTQGKRFLELISEIIQSRAKFWTILAFLFAFLVVIFDTIKLVRVFSLKILRGIPKEFTFELNLILSTSYFCHLMGFVYALGLPEKDREKEKCLEKLREKEKNSKSEYTQLIEDELYDKKVNKILSLSAGIFIILVLVFHITSTALLIDYSPPNYLLI